jgi:hypothetical protein
MTACSSTRRAVQLLNRRLGPCNYHRSLSTKSSATSSFDPTATHTPTRAFSSHQLNRFSVERNRTFHSSAPALSSLKTIKDPHHPSGVYYHPLSDSNQYAISFLEKPPTSSSSASIIAYVTPPPSSKEPIYDLIVQKPDLLEANKKFVQLLHETLKEQCVPQDGLLEYEALLRTDGWAHLNGAFP